MGTVKMFHERVDDVLVELGAGEVDHCTPVDADIIWLAGQIVSVRGEIEGYSWTDAPENARRARLRESTLIRIARRLIASVTA